MMDGNESGEVIGAARLASRKARAVSASDSHAQVGDEVRCGGHASMVRQMGGVYLRASVESEHRGTRLSVECTNDIFHPIRSSP